MSNEKKAKSKAGFWVILYIFFFLRSFLVIPVEYLGINIEYPISYVFSFPTAANWIMLAVFSVVACVFVLKLNDAFGSIAGVLSILFLSEPVFLMLSINPINLFLVSEGLIFILFLFFLSGNSLKTVMFVAHMFITAFMMPDFIFSFCALSFVVFLIWSEKSKKTVLCAISGLISSVLGLAVNKLMCDFSSEFKDLLDTYSFKEVLYVEKSFKCLIAFVPFMILTAMFLHKYIKKVNRLNKKEKSEANGKSELIFNLAIILYVLAFVGYFFFGEYSFFTVNIILPVVILVLFVKKDVVSIRIIEEASDFLKKHRLIVFLILFVSYYISAKCIFGYVNGYKIIEYLMY